MGKNMTTYPFVYNLGKRLAHLPGFSYEVILEKRGNHYYYNTRAKNINLTIEGLSTFPDFYYEYSFLQKLLDKKESAKLVKRAIKLGLLQTQDNIVVSKRLLPFKNSQYRGLRRHYKRRTRRGMSQYRFQKQRLTVKQPKEANKQLEDIFDNVSSNSFGHPRSKFNLIKKKLQKGYRRSTQHVINEDWL